MKVSMTHFGPTVKQVFWWIQSQATICCNISHICYIIQKSSQVCYACSVAISLAVSVQCWPRQMYCVYVCCLCVSLQTGQDVHRTCVCVYVGLHQHVSDADRKGWFDLTQSETEESMFQACDRLWNITRHRCRPVSYALTPIWGLYITYIADYPSVTEVFFTSATYSV